MTEHADEKRDKQINMRISESERRELDRVGEALGHEEHGRLAQTIRALPRLYEDREALLRAALSPVRGQLSRVEVDTILSAMNGVRLTRDIGGGVDLLGHHVALEVHDVETLTDGTPSKDLAARLARMSLATRVALELWCGDLWQRHEDHSWWEQEIGWLTSSPEA